LSVPVPQLSWDRCSGGPRTAAPTGGTTASGMAAPTGNPYLGPHSRAARERPPLRVVRPHREWPPLRGIRIWGRTLGRPENGRPYGRYDRIGNGRACGESVFGAAISGGPRTAAPTGGTTASGTAAPAGNPYLAPQSRAARERPPLRVVRPHRERPPLRVILLRYALV